MDGGLGDWGIGGWVRRGDGEGANGVKGVYATAGGHRGLEGRDWWASR